jgi:ABC-type multidrug transport system fused ATPase/permease subunit
MASSRGSANLARYRQRQAREELSGPFAWPHAWWYFALLAVAALVYGLLRLPAPEAWLVLSTALALGCLALGLRRHAEWARWVAFVLFAGSAVAGLFLVDWPSWSEDPFQSKARQLLVNVLAAVYLALPSTGRVFRTARGEAAHARAS